MSKTCSGELAELYLARHSGFENRMAYGDMFRALRLPEGTALQQRISDRRRRDARIGRLGIQVWYENQHGSVKTAFYFVRIKDAPRILREHEEKKAKQMAKKGVAA